MMDVIYSRYGGAAQDVLNLEFTEGMDILRLAIEEITDQKLYARWITGYDREMTFDAFKTKAKQKKEAKETPEQTLAKVAKITEMRV